MEAGIRDDLKDVLNKFFVKIMPNTTVLSIREDGAEIQCGEHVSFYPCDTVVLAVGSKAFNPLSAELDGLCEVAVVGDAIQARKAINASREGFVAGLEA